MVKYLLEKGADIDAKSNNGWTSLIYASINKHVEVAKYLLEKADINTGNENGKTALDVAKGYVYKLFEYIYKLFEGEKQ